MISMMREGMVRFRDANFGTGAKTEFANHEKRCYARQIALEGQRQEIEHQRRVVGKRRWCGSGLDDHRELAADLLLRFLNPPLDVTDSVQKLIELHAIRGAES